MTTSTDPTTSTLEDLDFDPTCDGKCADGEPCQATATFSAHVHHCGHPQGRITLFCDEHLAKFTTDLLGLLARAASRTAQCAHCHQRFTTVSEIIWDAQPIR